MFLANLRGWSVCILFAAIGVLTGLCLAELTLRLVSEEPLDRVVYSPLLGPVRPSSSVGVHAASEFSVRTRLNSMGFNDEERSPLGTSGVCRLGFFGDSMTEALQVHREENFVSRVGHSLRDLGAVETLNLGVSGFGTTQSRLLYEKVMKDWKIDIPVLVLYWGNDIRNNSIMLEQGLLDYTQASRPYLELQRDGSLLHLPVPQVDRDSSSLRSFLLSQSRLVRFVHSIVLRTPLIRNLATWTGLLHGLPMVADDRGVPIDFGLYEEPWKVAWESAWEVTKSELKNFTRLAKSRGSLPIIVTLWPREVIYDQDWNMFREGYPAMQRLVFAREERLRRLETELIRAKFPVLSLGNVLLENKNSGERLYFPLDGHLTSYGHSVVAKYIVACLSAGTQSPCNDNALFANHLPCNF